MIGSSTKRSTLSGIRAEWACDRAALRATDDPDSKNGLDYASGTCWHVYDERGDTYGGAPEAVEVWFDRVQARPMHTEGRWGPEVRPLTPPSRSTR